MNNEINCFQDLIKEEFDIEKAVLDDELDEDGELLDIVISDNDEKRVEFQPCEIDPFIEQMDIEVGEIIEAQKEEEMQNLREFFDEDAMIFEDSVDEYLDELDEIEDIDLEDDLDAIDNMEGLVNYSDEEAFSAEEL